MILVCVVYVCVYVSCVMSGEQTQIQLKAIMDISFPPLPPGRRQWHVIPPLPYIDPPPPLLSSLSLSHPLLSLSLSHSCFLLGEIVFGSWRPWWRSNLMERWWRCTWRAPCIHAYVRVANVLAGPEDGGGKRAVNRSDAKSISKSYRHHRRRKEGKCLVAHCLNAQIAFSQLLLTNN